MVARALPAGDRLPARPDFHVVIGPRSRRRPVGQWLMLALSGFALLLLLLLSRIALDRGAFVIQELETRITAEEARYWELRMMASELRDPARIAESAGAMGMVYPDEVFAVEVPGLGSAGGGIEERWLSLKTLLSAQP